MKRRRNYLWAILFVAAMCPLTSLPAAEEAATRPATTRPATNRAARPKRGEIIHLEADSITAMPNRPPMHREKLETETWSLDDQTQVYIGQVTSERTNDAGQRTQTIEMVRGSRDDLKVGRRVLMIKADAGRAVRIDLMPLDPPTTRKAE